MVQTVQIYRVLTKLSNGKYEAINILERED